MKSFLLYRAGLGWFLCLMLVLPQSLFATPASIDWNGLSQENAWLQLGHYRSGWFGVRSQVDDPDFFLHPQGATQPARELEATYLALQDALSSDLPEDQDVRCRYPARVHWLNQRLDLQLPARECEDLDAWLTRLDPAGLTLVFPSAYLNDAASMFGHTLLRVDSRDRQRRPELVDYAIDFAAEVTEGDGAIAYAFKGIFGGYPGYFNLMPYYEKVNEYSNIENRDMWEHPLSLSDEEVHRVLWHLWELQGVYFTYWFFDENCAYQLLALLSVARDDLNLTQAFSVKTLPVDALKALDQAGLLAQAPVFRASFATRLDTMARQLNTEELQPTRQLALDLEDPRDVEIEAPLNAAAIYETASEWVGFRFQHQSLPREEAAPQQHRLLVARAGLRGQRSGLAAVTVPDTPPHLGHDTARWGLGGGWHDGSNFLSLKGRPAYHDLLDDPAGYLPNAAINLFEAELRYYPDEQRWVPWKLALVEVGNYLQTSPVFNLSAWRVQADWQRTHPEASLTGHWRTRLGAGYGRAWGDSRVLMGYGFIQSELEAGPQAGVDPDETQRDYAAGMGLNLGGVVALGDSVRLLVDAQGIEFALGNRGRLLEVQAGLQWNFHRQSAIRVSTHWSQRANIEREASLSWLRYF